MGEQDEANRKERAEAKAQGRKPEFVNGWTVQKAERSPEDAYEVAATFCEEELKLLNGKTEYIEAFQQMVSKGFDILNSRFAVEGGEAGEGDAGNA